MADHLREQILDAIGTLLTGLTTTETRVTRLRAGSLSPSDLPGLNIVMGDEQVQGDRGQMVFNAVDVALEVGIEIRVSATDGQLDQSLNLIAAEVYAAMRGLSVTGIQHSYYAGASAPDLVEDAVTPVALQQLTYIVEYRHDIDDATTAA